MRGSQIIAGSNRPWRHRAVLVLALTAAAGTGISGCVRPDPLLDDEIAARVGADMAQMYADQEPLNGPLGLHEAVARGLKYNLDKRLKMMELGLAKAGLRYKHMDMLPKLAAQAGWRARNRFRGSSSRSLITGNQSLEVSTSEDKRVRYGDLQLVWNLLDFGLTYLRVRQEADKVLIAEERRIKVTQNLVMDIRDAYWRAVAAQRLIPQINRLIGEMARAINRSRRMHRSGDGEPADELKLQRALLTHKRDMMEVRRKLSIAKGELASLINLPPGTRFRVRVARHHSFAIPHLRGSIDAIETAALSNRPELREEDYKHRISVTEVRAAYVRLLPGIELRVGRNYDSNSFLYDNYWSNAGALLTKNLMELATAPVAIAYARQDVKTAVARRRALSMAVLAQVHIALHRYALARDLFKVSSNIYRVDRQLSDIATRGAAGSDRSDADALEARSRRLVSALRFYTAYADVQAAYGRILNSVGAHRYPQDIEEMDVKSLAKEIASTIDDWHAPAPQWQVATR